MGGLDQSVTYRYREFPVPGIFHCFGGIGTGIGKKWYRKKVSEPVSEKFGTGKSLGTGIGKIWYRKKVSEPVSEKFGTGADFCCQNCGIQNVSNGYRNRYREFLIFSGGIGKIWYRKSLETGIGKIWYWKKVSEPVSEKFGTEKVPVLVAKLFGTGKKYRY